MQGEQQAIAYLLIVVTALILRLLHLWAIKNGPFFSVLLGDCEGYDRWALAIAHGDWIGSQTFYQAPFYLYFLGLICALFGHSVLIVKLVQIGLGALACFLLAAAGRRFFSRKEGILSGFLLACYPKAIFFDCVLEKASVGLFFMCLLLFLS